MTRARVRGWAVRVRRWLWVPPGEEGAVGSVWAILTVLGAFTVLLGMVVDGGQALDDRQDASRVAAQAARRGADELSSASVRNGGDAVAVQRAEAGASGFLRAAGMSGTVRVDGDQVSVTVRGRSKTKILTVIGIDSFPITEEQGAKGIEGQGDGP